VLRNLFRKKDLAELTSEAEALFAEQRFGEAKLAYDRAAERAHKDKHASHEALEARASECCDRLALKRAHEAEELFASGQDELARDELRHALDTARSAAVLEQVRDVERRHEGRDAVAQAQEAAPLSDEEHLMLLTSTWEPLQAAELETYGEPLLEAILAIERGLGEQAVATLRTLLERSPSASYLWLELGRAHLSSLRSRAEAGGTRDEEAAPRAPHAASAPAQPSTSSPALDQADRALRTFLSRIGPEEGGAARLLAHRELARIAHERGDREAAVLELEAASEALSDDPRPLLDLGNYLRLIERPREAVEVLELCAAAFGDNEVEWPVTMELGLACAAAGDDERATRLLEGVLEALLAKGHVDLPPTAVVALAKLHEAHGNAARAADLYRALTRGSDADNHARYHLEAARLLDVLKLTDEAARMRERARALGGLPASAIDPAAAPSGAVDTDPGAA
jgi:tetratricopeptide (TPR) repeat protein